MWIMLIADDRVGALDRPRRRGDVERERRQEVRQAGVGAMSRDARERFRIAIGRLPGQPRQRGRAMHGMLAGAARDLEHRPAGRQHAAQHGKDRLAIARRRGRGERLPSSRSAPPLGLERDDILSSLSSRSPLRLSMAIFSETRSHFSGSCFRYSPEHDQHQRHGDGAADPRRDLRERHQQPCGSQRSGWRRRRCRPGRCGRRSRSRSRSDTCLR